MKDLAALIAGKLCTSIKAQSPFIVLSLSIVIAANLAVDADENPSREHPPGLAFRYERPAEGAATIRHFEGALPPAEGVVNVYATIQMGPANPIKYVGGLPEWRPEGAVVATHKPQETVDPGDSAPAGFKFEATTDDPHENIGRRVVSWKADDERFPDQYQLDHIVEVEASANGYEQGYSGWVQLEDGRVFVVNYTDDTAPVAEGHGSGYGIP